MTQEEFKKKAMLKPKKKTIMGLPVTPEIVNEMSTRNLTQSIPQKPQVIAPPPLPTPVTSRPVKKVSSIPTY